MGNGCFGFLVIGASGVYAELVSSVVAAGAPGKLVLRPVSVNAVRVEWELPPARCHHGSVQDGLCCGVHTDLYINGCARGYLRVGRGIDAQKTLRVESSADTSGLYLRGRPRSSSLSLSDSLGSSMVSPASESSAAGEQGRVVSSSTGSTAGGGGVRGSSLSKVGLRYQERGQSIAM